MAFVAGSFGLAWKISASYTSIETRIEALNTRFDSVEKKINEGAAQNVSERDLRLWMMLLRDKNKALDIPEWVK